MRALAVAAALTALPTVAAARPITAGVSVGSAQSKADADRDANTSLGLFGRIALTRRLSGQLELSKLQLDDETNYDHATIRKLTALVVFDVLDRGALVPMLLAGLGIDRDTSDWYERSGDHVEAGVGLEYRARGGLTLGVDLRIGSRSIEERFEALPVEGDIALVAAPAHLSEGEYRTLRLSLGVRF